MDLELSLVAKLAGDTAGGTQESYDVQVLKVQCNNLELITAVPQTSFLPQGEPKLNLQGLCD